MTITATALAVTAFITGERHGISLLDAIIVLYILLLPILASAFGISRLMRDANRAASPMLILANWTRSALTYSLALYVWVRSILEISDKNANIDRIVVPARSLLENSEVHQNVEKRPSSSSSEHQCPL